MIIWRICRDFLLCRFSEIYSRFVRFVQSHPIKITIIPIEVGGRRPSLYTFILLTCLRALLSEIIHSFRAKRRTFLPRFSYQNPCFRRERRTFARPSAEHFGRFFIHKYRPRSTVVPVFSGYIDDKEVFYAS